MTVARVLNQKGSTAVETISGGASVSDAAKVLSEKRYGALVVSDDGATVSGIISERDLVRMLGREGADCLGRKVSEVMTGAVMTCEPTDLVMDVLTRMTQGRFRHMPVVVDGRLEGVISIGDVVAYRLRELEHEREALTDMIAGR